MIKLCARRYITKGVILVLTSFFYMTKVTYYILMVFDATVIRLNNSMWAPKSMLPSMGRFIIMVGPETHMVNIDVGEKFYNFRISSLLAK